MPGQKPPADLAGMMDKDMYDWLDRGDPGCPAAA